MHAAFRPHKAAGRPTQCHPEQHHASSSLLCGVIVQCALCWSSWFCVQYVCQCLLLQAPAVAGQASRRASWCTSSYGRHQQTLGSHRGVDSSSTRCRQPCGKYCSTSTTSISRTGRVCGKWCSSWQGCSRREGGSCCAGNEQGGAGTLNDAGLLWRLYVHTRGTCNKQNCQ